MQSIEKKLLMRIKRYESGSVFSPVEFLDLGSRSAVGIALHRLEKAGKIKRLGRGLYHCPQKHPLYGELAPSPENVARALTGKLGVRLQPSGAYAANLLRLSDQVPAKIVYLTDGIGKKIRLGKMEILLKRTTPRNMITAGRLSGLIIQALRYLGRKHVDEQVVRRLKNNLKAEDRRDLKQDAVHAPAWIADILRKLSED